MPIFLIEGCLALYLKSEVLTKDYVDGSPVAMLPLIEVIKTYANLFYNEHFTQFELSKKSMLSRVDYFVSLGYLSVDNDTVKIANKERAMTLLNFFSGLISPLIDTYLVTLSAIQQICGKNLVLKNKKFIKELHACIKRLVHLNVIPDLHSCLNEII